MAENFNLISKSLSSNYVYYDRLAKEGYANLYSAVRSQVLNAKNKAEEVRADTSFIRKQADNERTKELNLIEKMTGARPTPTDWGQDAENIIDAINMAMNLKDVYKRSYAVITQGGKTQGKGSYSFFGGYLQGAINKLWPDFVAEHDIEELLGPNQEQIILSWLREEVLTLAITNMFNAKTEIKELQEDPAIREAYKELIDIMGRFDKAGSFAAEMADIFNLEGVAKEIMERVSINGANKKPGGIKSLTKQNQLSYQRGGYTLEALYDTITEAVFSKKGIKGGHARIGQANAKADNIATIGIDFSRVQDYLEGKELGTRIQNVDVFTKLGRHLEGLSDSFIVYTSDKNYTINEGFRQRYGFSAGSEIDFKTYEAIMLNVDKNVKTFVGAMEQLAKDAIGQDISQRDYADIISKNIAYLLFDDFDAIGAGLTNGPQSIHIMNLNGVLLPISTILYALADAIENGKNIGGIVKTTLNIPDIEFPTAVSQREWEEKNPGESAWHYQKTEMLDKATIETHFLGNLKQMLKNRTFR